MSSGKSYLPSQRMMPVYTSISPPQTERPPEFPYDPVPSKAMSALSKAGTYGLAAAYKVSQAKAAGYALHAAESPKSTASSSYGRMQEFPYDPPDKSKPPDFPYDSLTNGGKPGQAPPVAYSRGEDKSSPPSLALAYPRMQDFPYGLSGVAMPSYNYSSELYSYVSNGFPRKSRMCSYCGKVFTRSTTRRYHEKRCPLLRAAGSLLKNDTQVSAASAAAAVAAAKSETSPHATSQYSSANTSTYTPVSSSTHTSFSHPYSSTSSAVVDQNRNAVSGIKGEPREYGGPSPSNSDSFNQGDHVSTRYTPDYDSPNPRGMMFSPPIPDRVSESPISLQTDNQTASDVPPPPPPHNTGEPSSSSSVFKDSMDHSLPQDSGADDYYGSAGYHKYKDHILRQSSQLSGNATSSYNDDISQGTSVDGSGISHEKTQEIETLEYEKSKPSQKSVLANKCSICGKAFESARQLHIHEQLHTKYKPYACRFCGQRFLKVSMRIAHERLHIGEKPYVCAVCGLTFTRKYSVRLHMRRRHTDGPCLCRYCGKTMYTLQSLKTHLLSHGLPKSEKESLHYLNTTTSGERSIDAADETVEDADTGAAPQAAGQATQEDPLSQVNKDIAMAMEMEMAGNSKEKEWCKLCEKEFPKSFMRYHERLHADQKPYECPTCKKRFGYKNNMKSHMKLHAGIKPYQCHICGAKFTRGSTLRRHARRHGIFTESVWDFFVQKGKQNAMEKQNIPQEQATVPSLQIQTHGISQSSPEVTSSRSTQADSASVTPDSSLNYEMSNYPTTAIPSAGAYSGYAAAVPSIPESIYPTYPSTSPFSVQYSGYNASQEPQADALNLSVHKALGAGPELEGSTAEAGETSEGDGEEIKSNVSSHTCTSNGASIGVQVSLCACSEKPSALSTLPFDHGLLSPLNLDGSCTSATSPSLSSGGDNFNNETVSTLMGSGRLFRCPHCDCYFSEYAMYRIHQKLHAKDANRPFLCPVCFEDCHDKMYYALHLYEHLRM